MYFLFEQKTAYEVRISDWTSDVCSSYLADLTKVYDSVNQVQDTPWRINCRVLDVMEKVWDGGGSLGGLPQRNDESLPPKPLDIDTNEEAKLRWKKAAAEVYTRNADRVSARMAQIGRAHV